jgi:predicted CXXCH cytochrome family protein
MAGVLGVCLLLAGVVSLSDPARAGVATTKHNLSASGPGTIKAVSETQICRFCHIPHNASPAVPLWGHALSSGTYTVYTSSTIQGTTGQPTGSSKLCLACHDGAVALGAVVASYSVRSGSIAMTGTLPDGRLPAGATNLGLDLRNDHPVSLLPATGGGADPEILLTPTDSRVKYDATGRVQCSSCHNPHDSAYGKFLVKPMVAGGVGSQLCLDCHAKFNWTSSSHRNSTSLWNARTLKEQGCAICHKPHTTPVATRLLLAAEEALCNPCHDGSPAVKNVAGEFSRPYRHPLSISGKHDPAETFANLNDPLRRHAECEDCHNPHSAQAGTHAQGSSKIGAVLLGAWGMKPIYNTTPWTDPVSWQKVTFTDTAGADMIEAYLCFKCHQNLARAWNPNNPSFHAVMASRTDGTFGPKAGLRGQYLAPWTRTSHMTCSDCHTSSNSAVKGPHGSDHAANGPYKDVLLFTFWERAYDSTNKSYARRGTGGTQYLSGSNYPSSGTPSVNANQLCFTCHDRRVYGHTTDDTYKSNSSVTGFSETGKNWHIEKHNGFPCASCHVAHGSNKKALLANYDDGWDLNAYDKILTMRSSGNWTQKSDCWHSYCQ